MPEYLEAKRHSTSAQLQVQQLEDTFVKHTKGLPRIILCLDAINECQDAAAIEDLLLRLVLRCSTLRVLVTSTRNLNIREPKNAPQILVIQMNFKNVNEDISVFVDGMLATDRGFKNITEELKSNVKSAVLNRAEGM